MALRFVHAETTVSYFNLVEEYLRNFGKPLAFYSDRFGVFRVNIPSRKAEALTQFGRAMQELDIQCICASSPQAKGRVERANGVLQDRLVKELRLRNISTIDEANIFLPAYLEEHNRRFAVAPRSDIDAHRALGATRDLDRILCLAHHRRVSKNLTVQFGATILEITEPTMSRRLIGSDVVVREHRNGAVSIERNGHTLRYRTTLRTQRRAAVVGTKELDAQGPRRCRIPNHRKGHPLAPNHPWHQTPRHSSNPKGDFLIGPEGDIIPLS